MPSRRPSQTKPIRKPPARVVADRLRNERRSYRVLRRYFAGQVERIRQALVARYGENWTGAQWGAPALRNLRRDAARDMMGDAFWASERDLLLKILIPILLYSIQDGAAQGEAALLELSIGVDWELVNVELSQWIRSHAGALATQLTEVTRRSLAETIATWMQDGTGFPDLVGRVERIVGPARAMRVAVTETTRAFAAGNRAAWKQQRDVVEARQWFTAEDELVCPVCAALNMQVADLDKPFAGDIDDPPAHVNCRCITTPVVKSLVE
jgi:SPP1 gp7 family putative phage head morphogenesis protein